MATAFKNDIQVMQTPTGRKLTILVVDDDPLCRRIAEAYITKLGHLPVSVANGKEAVELLRRERFDLVLMDITMPVMDGLEATRVIREGEKGTNRHVPIVAVTGCTQYADPKHYRTAGMDGVVMKPYGCQQMRNALSRIILAHG